MNNTEHKSSLFLAIFLGPIPSGKIATSKKTHIFMVFETLSSLPQKGCNTHNAGEKYHTAPKGDI